MRLIDDTPMAKSWTTPFPAHWRQVVDDAIERHGSVRCERWKDELVQVRDGLPLPVPFEDPVLDGFARKTAQRLRHICACCAKPAKPRSVPGGWQVKCAGCWGKSQLSVQIQKLLDEAHGVNLTPFDGKPALWHEHEMSVLLRSAIPGFCWRKLSLPQGETIRYLAREDVMELGPWLKQLQKALGDGGTTVGINSES